MFVVGIVTYLKKVSVCLKGGGVDTMWVVVNSRRNATASLEASDSTVTMSKTTQLNKDNNNK